MFSIHVRAVVPGCFAHFRALSTKNATFKPLLGRYDIIPCDSFRINTSAKVILRDYDQQMKKGRSSYDLKIAEDGLVHPKPGPDFEGA